jgi:hypothetical protein
MFNTSAFVGEKNFNVIKMRGTTIKIKSNLCSLNLTRPRLVYVLLHCKLRSTGFIIGHFSLKKYSVIYSDHITFFTHR